MDENIGLTEFPRALKAYTKGKTISYASAYQRVLNGELPATKKPNGRWVISRSDLPSIAQILGLETH